MIKLSPTSITTFETCPRQYYYRYVERWEPVKTRIAMPFGTAVHSAWEAHLRGMVSGPPADPPKQANEMFQTSIGNAQTLKAFNESFQVNVRDAHARGGIELGKLDEDKPNPEEAKLLEFDLMGQAFAAQIPAAWEATGLRPMITGNGEPAIEYWLEADMTHGVQMRARLDVVTIDANAETTVVDFKTGAGDIGVDFVQGSDQVAIQQYLLEANAATAVVESPARIGFMSCVKRKVPSVKKNGEPNGKGPQIMPPVTVPAHDAKVLLEFKEKWLADAAQIARGVFPKRPLRPDNTPCDMCEFKKLCMHGIEEGLRKRH